MEDEVDEFLAHFGVKGMKWGKRKARDDSSSGKSGGGKSAKPPMSDEQKAQRNAKLKKGAAIAGGVALAAGIAAVGIHMKKSGAYIPVSSLSSAASSASRPSANASLSLNLSPRTAAAVRNASHTTTAGRSAFDQLMRDQALMSQQISSLGGNSQANSILNNTFNQLNNQGRR